MGKTSYTKHDICTTKKHPHNVGKTYTLKRKAVVETSPQRGEDNSRCCRTDMQLETSPQRGEDASVAMLAFSDTETSPQRGEDAHALDLILLT